LLGASIIPTLSQKSFLKIVFTMTEISCTLFPVASNKQQVTSMKNKMGQIYVRTCKTIGGWQQTILHRIADRTIGTIYEKHDPHWKFVNRWTFFGGHVPSPGGWFWSGGVRIGPWRVEYGEGWGDPGTWGIRKAK
jgi:hypothetical protein